MEQQLILHILRNPYGKGDQEINDARLAAADEIEKLQGELSKSRSFDHSDGLQRLGMIEELLQQLLKRLPALPSGPVSDIKTEIAQVKAAGGDLITHLKEKARRQMRQEAEEKKAWRWKGGGRRRGKAG